MILKDMYFPVLDYGFVALKDVMGDDTSIEEAARVSYGHGTRKRSETRGLIRYLMRHKHTTPFEMVEFKFHCAMPIFVARQWVRHRNVSLNEYSGRYSLMPMLFYTPEREQCATQSKTNNQGRDEDYLSEEDYEQFLETTTYLRNEAATEYTHRNCRDMARELARIDLPLSMYTYWYWKIDLHNLFHFLKLRCDSHAQWEIRQFANVMAGMVKEVCPLAFEAWYDYALMADNWTRLDCMLNIWIIQEMDESGWVTGNLKDVFDKMPEYHEFISDIGMSKREVEEFWKKLDGKEETDFTLDLSKSKPAEHFEKIIAENTQVTA